MPLTAPVIDDRRFGQLVQETLARARVHTPEWTNFGQGDPGVTLVQLFSFLTETLLYRANLLPERNRSKFLQLLRVPLAAATAAQGLVSIQNERGAAQTEKLAGDLEVRAGAVPFRTQLAIDVLPIEARAYFKRTMTQTPAVVDYYRLLYASYQLPFPDDVQLYETVALDPAVVESVDLSADTVDHALWLALLARKNDQPDPGDDPWMLIRKQLGGRTLTLGIVPALDATSARLVPGGNAQPAPLLQFGLPSVPQDRAVPRDANGRPAPIYRQLDAHSEVDVLAVPGVVQLGLPPADELGLWSGVDPLEGGAGDMPPTLDDPAVGSRVITWLRVQAAGAAARVRWAGINVAPVRQIERIAAEPLADGDGTPDQTRRLARAPVLPESVVVVTRLGDDQPQRWEEIDDLAAADPEVPVTNPRWAGTPASVAGRDPNPNVFELDPESGELRFGDGLRGRRLPRAARVYVSYEFCQGALGNVSEGAINSAPQLPSGFTVRNPTQTWGGADAETVDIGEKQIRRYLQHRDRLVSVDDFEAIACRTPGVQIGRVEILPAFHPDLVPNEPGAAPGVVTVMVVPRFDPAQPDAPRPDRLFLNAICRYLDARRLVTTELIVRGPLYKGIWISVGIDVAAGFSIAQVVDDVKTQLRALLAPVGPAGCVPRDTPLITPRTVDPSRGWPLRAPVVSRVLLAAAARVTGVTAVSDVLLAEGNSGPTDVVDMTGLELPRVLGIMVAAGDPVPIDVVRGSAAAPTTKRLLPVPIVPASCA